MKCPRQGTGPKTIIHQTIQTESCLPRERERYTDNVSLSQVCVRVQTIARFNTPAVRVVCSDDALSILTIRPHDQTFNLSMELLMSKSKATDEADSFHLDT